MANWLDAIIAGYNTLEVEGVEVTTSEQRRTLNFTGGVSAADDPVNERINVSWGGAASLCTAALQGEVNAFTATANLMLCSDGSTAGGVWRNWIGFGTTVASVGDIRGDSTLYVYGLNGGAANTKLLYWDGATLELGDQANATTLLHSALTSQQFNIGATALLALAAGAVTAPGNPTFDFGTNTVSVDIFRVGNTPPATGTVRWSDHTTVHGLDHAGTGTTSLIDWGDTTQDHLTIGANDGDLDGVDIVAGAAGEIDFRIAAANLLKIAAGAISYPSNPTHALGTNYVTHGATPASAGSFRLTDGDNFAFAAGNYALASGQGTSAFLGGPYPNRPVNAYADATTEVALQLGGTSFVTLDASFITFGKANVVWPSSITSPSISIRSTSTAGVTAQDITISGQNVTAATGTAQAGSIILSGGTPSGSATNRYGNLGMHLPPASWCGGERIMFIRDAITAPTLAPTNGHFVYDDPTSENLMALGEDNTLTTLALK